MSEQANTGYFAIGPIEHLTKGWAVMPFIGRKAHHWTEDTKTMQPTIRDGGRVRYYVSACGLLSATSKSVPALNPGNFPKCKRCQRSVK